MSFFFPPEIEDEIFKHVIRMRPYHPNDALLPTVSRRVQASVEPVLYETIVLYGSKDVPTSWSFETPYEDFKFITTTLPSRPPAFFARHVKNLLMTTIVRPEEAILVLSICTGVRHLAFWHSDLDVKKLIAPLPLRSLDTTINILHQLRELPQEVAFPELTYLSTSGLLDELIIPELYQFPSLQHLEFLVGRYITRIPEDIGQILKSTNNNLQRLSLIIVQDEWNDWYFGEDKEVVLGWMKQDPRIVVHDHHYVPQFSALDWEDRVRMDSEL